MNQPHRPDISSRHAPVQRITRRIVHTAPWAPETTMAKDDTERKWTATLRPPGEKTSVQATNVEYLIPPIWCGQQAATAPVPPPRMLKATPGASPMVTRVSQLVGRSIGRSVRHWSFSQQARQSFNHSGCNCVSQPARMPLSQSKSQSWSISQKRANRPDSLAARHSIIQSLARHPIQYSQLVCRDEYPAKLHIA